MTMDLHYASLLDVSGLIRSRAVSAVEVCQSLLDRIARLDGKLNGFLAVLSEGALAQAARADAELAAGLWRGPLHGIPVAIKDLLDVAGSPTTSGTAIFKDLMPEDDATVVARLKRAGAVIIGKAHMTEGATLAHHPSLPRPDNPWKAGYWTGVSSSGSGVTVAAGFCYGALGTDTGGSIRMPSAACGLSGMKPTWGRVSRDGLFPLAQSFDHIGPMCRTAADAAAMLQAMAGADPKDQTALNAPVPDYLAGIGAGISGLKIGIDPELIEARVDPVVLASVQAALKVFEDLGARVVEVKLPPLAPLLGTVFPLLTAEVMAAHADTFPRLADAYGPDLRRMLEAGAPLTAMDVARCIPARAAFAGELRKLFDVVDLLLTPAAPSPTLTWDEIEALAADQAAMMDRIARYTIPFNVTGSPTLSLPSGLASSGLPLGIQLIGPHLGEAMLFRAGHAFQQATDHHTLHPELG
jgi:amidase